MGLSAKNIFAAFYRAICYNLFLFCHPKLVEGLNKTKKYFHFYPSAPHHLIFFSVYYARQSIGSSIFLLINQGLYFASAYIFSSSIFIKLSGLISGYLAANFFTICQPANEPILPGAFSPSSCVFGPSVT